MWGDNVNYKTEYETIVGVFNSECGPKKRGFEKEYSDIILYLEEKKIIRSMHSIKRKYIIPEKNENDWKTYLKCRRGGGDIHGLVKWWAYCWLRDESKCSPFLEYGIEGYGRADLADLSRKIIVECGNTSPGHCIYALEKLDCSSFIIIPFQRSIIEMFTYCEIMKVEVFEFSKNGVA